MSNDVAPGSLSTIRLTKLRLVAMVFEPPPAPEPKEAGKDLTGQKFLDAMESGKPFDDIFGNPTTKFSKTNHLASTITSVQQVKNGRWVMVKDGLQF